MFVLQSGKFPKVGCLVRAHIIKKRKINRMKNIYSKALLPVLVAAFVAIPFFGAQADIAKPKIRSIESVTSRTVLLPITWDQYNKSVDARVKIRITNLMTGAIMFQQMDARVNGNGHTNVWVKGLKAGTDYAFKVKVRKITLSDFSPYSRMKKAMTSKAVVAATAPAAPASTDTSANNAPSQ